MEEMFDVVDDQDQVMRQAPRSLVHARQWLHRAVHVFVFNSRGELLLQRRSASKDEYPLKYTSSASGHLSAGETYDSAVVRELAEEMGLCCPLESLHRFPAGPETSFEHTHLYRAVTDEEPQCDPLEVEAGEFHEPAEIERWIDRQPDDFTPCFITLFRWYQVHASECQPLCAAGEPAHNR